MLGENTSAPGLRVRAAEEDNIPAAITDVGCEREINEDRYAVIDSPSGRAWVVCDGMGGSLGGELAAQLAIDAIRRALESQDYASTSEALRSAVEEANRIIVLRRQNPSFSSMGTTIVGGIIQDDEVSIVHAGDSRAYLVRDKKVEQLTVDHTYVQDLVDRGALSPEEALTHPQSHVLTRCLGAGPRIELDSREYWIWKANEGETLDKLVLCSDGLYSLVSDDEIAEAVSSRTPQDACVFLVELAKSRGGYDNITIAVLPLGGRLHDESPSGSRGLKKKKQSKKAQVKRQRKRLTVGQRVLVMMMLALLGCLFGALFVMFGVAR